MDSIMRYHYGTASRELSTIYLSKIRATSLYSNRRFQFASVNSLRVNSPHNGISHVLFLFVSRIISLKYYRYISLLEYRSSEFALSFSLSAKPPHKFNIDHRTLTNDYPSHFPSLSGPLPSPPPFRVHCISSTTR